MIWDLMRERDEDDWAFYWQRRQAQNDLAEAYGDV
jgi:hypothetical protein